MRVVLAMIWLLLMLATVAGCTAFARVAIVVTADYEDQPETRAVTRLED